jgi:uroporphyrin-III C-methyltransferase
LAAFFGSTELYSKYRIIEAAHSINADCYHAQSFFQSVSTLVIYMGVSGVAHIQDELLYGLPDTTPVAVVQNASLPTQRHAVCTLAELQATITREGLASPSVIVVGDVMQGLLAAAQIPGREARTA